MARKGAAGHRRSTSPKTCCRSRDCMRSKRASTVDYLLQAAEDARGDPCRRLRRRHLHGDARARSRPHVRDRGDRPAGPPGRPRLRLDAEPHAQGVRAGRSSAPNTCCGCCTPGTHTYEKFIRPSELKQLGRGGRAVGGRHRRPRLRPVRAQGHADQRRQRQLPRAPAARCAGSGRYRRHDTRSRGPLRPRRHAARHRTGHGRRAESPAHRGRPRAAALRRRAQLASRTAPCA